ncbi:MAG: SusC/RagA family TonB-linked outer membrane protein [Chitinophagaceae bacterium]
MHTNTFMIRCLLTMATLFPAAYSQAGIAAMPPQVADTTAKTIKGVVNDAEGHILAEVDITNKRTQETVQSSKDGSFSIDATPADELELTMEGFATITYTVTGKENGVLQLVLHEQSLAAAKNVQMSYGIRRADQVTSSFDVIYNRELIKSPVVDITNALSGRLAGLYTLQQGATPGSEQAAIYLRGVTSPLIVIDGIPRNYTLLNPNEIESITVLKDGLSANLYGIRASNGALLINTRKGVPGKQVISFTAQYGIQKPTKLPSYLHAYDYASLFNEALANDGKPAQYTNADLQAYKDGSDPYGHPDVNWQKQVLRNQMSMARYSADVSGGGKFAQYYLALDHVNQQGVFVTDKSKNTYNTNNDYKQYSIRSNVMMNVNSTLKAYLNVFALIRNGNQPGVGTSAIFSDLLNVPNNAYPVFNPDGSYGGTTERTTNLYARTVNSGYISTYNRNLYADVGLQKSLDAVTKGLWIRAKASFGTDLTETINRSKTFATYKMNVDPVSGDTTYTKFNTDGTQNNSGSISSQTRNNYWDVTLGYDKSLAGGHTIAARAIASSQQYGISGQLPTVYTTYSVNGQYNYKNRYDVELSVTANKQNLYPKHHDLGVFPAAGLGWTISNENWFPRTKVLNSLRLKASYGRTGMDDIGYYVYSQFYGSATGYTLGVSPTSSSGASESTLANPYITWEKADKFNIGISTTLLGNKLRAEVEYYNDTYFDLVQTRGRSLASIGATYPDENIGKNRYYGIDLTLQYENNAGAVKYYAGLKLGTRQSKVIFMDEVDRRYSWMERTGQKVGQLYGYVAEGFYSASDITNKIATLEGYTPVAGDIKYKDLNNDGVINRYDIAAIGNTKPFISAGFQAGVEYKGVSLSFLLQGVMNRDLMLNSTDYEFQAVSGGGYTQAQQHHLGRWTPATAATATYPRLSVGSNANNQTTSTFWLHKGDYLRLKNVELSWSLPRKWVNAVKLGGARLFVNGFNLLTFTQVDRLDPEYPYATGYPNLKSFNAGFSIKF